eukprot:TRINITY_DN3286_c0_g2_i1.p1 TRINITY_DN3286_c0_g2~~TRINITY_DN3286_c0_g2_i1.p1  ORF type:complete len:431 (+),score=151.11 TRINITY_DN3286_c0_g2_i1:59-1294(+)
MEGAAEECGCGAARRAAELESQLKAERRRAALRDEMTAKERQRREHKAADAERRARDAELRAAAMEGERDRLRRVCSEAAEQEGRGGVAAEWWTGVQQRLSVLSADLASSLAVSAAELRTAQRETCVQAEAVGRLDTEAAAQHAATQELALCTRSLARESVSLRHQVQTSSLLRAADVHRFDVSASETDGRLRIARAAAATASRHWESRATWLRTAVQAADQLRAALTDVGTSCDAAAAVLRAKSHFTVSDRWEDMQQFRREVARVWAAHQARPPPPLPTAPADGGATLVGGRLCVYAGGVLCDMRSCGRCWQSGDPLPAAATVPGRGAAKVPLLRLQAAPAATACRSQTGPLQGLDLTRFSFTAVREVLTGGTPTARAHEPPLSARRGSMIRRPARDRSRSRRRSSVATV